MSWRKPVLRDIAAKLNQKELDEFRASPDFVSDADPVGDILELTAESVRGFCRSNKQLKMCPTAATIPEGLMTFAMDYAAFDILKRINIVPNEARKAAWEKAVDLFEKVASGTFIPESWKDGEEEQDDTSANRAFPHFTPQLRHRVIDANFV